MSTELTTTTDSLPALMDQLPVAPHAEAFSEYAKAGDFLPRIQLCGSKTGLVAEGKIDMNHYALVTSKDSLVDLGKSLVCVPFSTRIKAMRMVEGENPVTYYNIDNPEFKKVVWDANNTKDSGCMFGLEFLLWLPDQKRYATFFFNSKSSRKEAPNMQARIGLACTLDSRLADSGKYKWQVPVVKPFSTPVDVPAFDQIKSEVGKFVDVHDSVVELANPATDRER